MNKRILSEMRILAKGRNEVSVGYLAETFSVSERTIRNDLNEIDGILKEHGRQPLTVLNGIVKTAKDYDQVLDQAEYGDFYQYKLSKEERKLAAAAMLVNAPGYITLSAIADTLYVSRATIIHDLPEIKAYISEHALEVYSHPNRGLIVNGTEKDKRAFLLNIMTLARKEKIPVDPGKFISLKAGNQITISKILREQENSHRMHLTDASFKEVLCYLGVLISRNRQSAYIEDGGHEKGDYYLFAQDILRYLTQYCDFTTTEEEIRYFSRLLSKARFSSSNSGDHNAIRIQMKTRQIILSLSEELGIQLNTDYEIIGTHFLYAAYKYRSPNVVKTTLAYFRCHFYASDAYFWHLKYAEL